MYYNLIAYQVDIETCLLPINYAFKILILLLEQEAAQYNVKTVYCDSDTYTAGIVVIFRARILSGYRKKIAATICVSN